MKSIPNKIIPLLISILGLAIGYILAHPVLFNLCERTYTTALYVGCLDKTIDLIGYPFAAFFILALPISIIAMFVNEKTFKIWAKFIIWFVPISILASLITPISTHETLTVIVTTHDGTAHLFGMLFVIISLCIFILNSNFFVKTKSNVILK